MGARDQSIDKAPTFIGKARIHSHMEKELIVLLLTST